MQLKAYAKLNLALEILNLREDGYHELVGIMQTISLSDTLTIKQADSLILSVPGREDLLSEENLVLKAARLLAGKRKLGAEITLVKKIPHGAGLGGGSADAAFTLKALNRFWNLGYELSQLCSLAQSLGSDVPFFLIGGSAQVAGRGEIIKPLPQDNTQYWYLLLHPPFSISTPWAYRAFDQNPQAPSGATERVKKALVSGDAKSLGLALANNLEGPVFAEYPILAQYKKELLEAGAFGAAMSGSGSTLFGIFATEEDAKRAGGDIERLRPELKINVVSSVGTAELEEQEKAMPVEKSRERK